MGSTSARVYIVEDDDSVRISLGRLLAAADVNSISFASAEAFLAFLEHAADEGRDARGCAILDVHLPGMGGIELMMFVQRTYPDVRPVLITGSKDARVQAVANQAGVTLLEKPFDEAALLAAITPCSDAPPRAPGDVPPGDAIA